MEDLFDARAERDREADREREEPDDVHGTPPSQPIVAPAVPLADSMSVISAG
jgi:hypothetical protein